MAYRYVLFHKPYGVLTQFSDRQAQRKTLKDFINLPDVYPAGRLDRDSEGLLLLTNHGLVQHRLINPRYEHPRTYWVQVEQTPDESALNQLRQGVVIQQHPTRPAQAKSLTPPDVSPREPPIRFRKTVPTAWLEITLREGRNRQIRRMTAAVGYPTLRLIRVAIAHLRLAKLAPGEWRDLTTTELIHLKRLLEM